MPGRPQPCCQLTRSDRFSGWRMADAIKVFACTMNWQISVARWPVAGHHISQQQQQTMPVSSRLSFGRSEKLYEMQRVRFFVCLGFLVVTPKQTDLEFLRIGYQSAITLRMPN